MEDKIDLDAIIKEVEAPHPGRWDSISINHSGAKECMRIAIHQALVLASEKAKTKSIYPHGVDRMPDAGDVVVDKQSILEVRKLIV